MYFYMIINVFLYDDKCIFMMINYFYMMISVFLYDKCVLYDDKCIFK